MNTPPLWLAATTTWPLAELSMARQYSVGSPVTVAQVAPQLVGPNEVKEVVAAGDAAYADVCTADVEAKCAEYGVTE